MSKGIGVSSVALDDSTPILSSGKWTITIKSSFLLDSTSLTIRGRCGIGFPGLYMS